MSDFLGLLTGGGRPIVGIEDDADGSLRVYVDARYLGTHCHVTDEAEKTKVRNAWHRGAWTHLFAPISAAAICDCAVSA